MEKELGRATEPDGYTVCSGCGQHVLVPAKKIKEGRGNVDCPLCKAKTPVFRKTVHVNN